MHNADVKFEVLLESGRIYYRFKYELTEVIIMKPCADVQKNFATIMSVLPALLLNSAFSEAQQQHSN